MDDRLIAMAKQQAASQQKSLSMMVADYFRSFEQAQEQQGGACGQGADTPVTRSLHGMLKSSGVDEEDYHRHLLGKHR